LWTTACHWHFVNARSHVALTPDSWPVSILRMKAAELEQRLLHDARRSTKCADGSVP
jgi:hypothetical protein